MEKYIDREAWELCEMCKSCTNCWFVYNTPKHIPCNRCDEYSEYDPVGFCRYCGRPLTEEAWKELEKNGYSGVRLVAEWSIDELPSDEDFLAVFKEDDEE